MAIIQANPGWFLVSVCLEKAPNGEEYYEHELDPIIAWEIDDETAGYVSAITTSGFTNYDGDSSGILDPSGQVAVGKTNYKTISDYDKAMCLKHGWKTAEEVLRKEFAQKCLNSLSDAK